MAFNQTGSPFASAAADEPVGWGGDGGSENQRQASRELEEGEDLVIWRAMQASGYKFATHLPPGSLLLKKTYEVYVRIQQEQMELDRLAEQAAEEEEEGEDEWREEDEGSWGQVQEGAGLVGAGGDFGAWRVQLAQMLGPSRPPSAFGRRLAQETAAAQAALPPLPTFSWQREAQQQAAQQD
jgi:hypothetical protein